MSTFGVLLLSLLCLIDCNNTYAFSNCNGTDDFLWSMLISVSTVGVILLISLIITCVVCCNNNKRQGVVVLPVQTTSAAVVPFMTTGIQQTPIGGHTSVPITQVPGPAQWMIPGQMRQDPAVSTTTASTPMGTSVGTST